MSSKSHQKASNGSSFDHGVKHPFPNYKPLQTYFPDEKIMQNEKQEELIKQR